MAKGNLNAATLGVYVLVDPPASAAATQWKRVERILGAVRSPARAGGSPIPSAARVGAPPVVDETVNKRVAAEADRILGMLTADDRELLLLHMSMRIRDALAGDWKVEHERKAAEERARFWEKKTSETFENAVKALMIFSAVAGLVVGIGASVAWFFPPQPFDAQLKAIQDEFDQRRVELSQAHTQELRDAARNLPSTGTWADLGRLPVAVGEKTTDAGDLFQTIRLQDGTTCFRRAANASIVCSLPN